MRTCSPDHRNHTGSCSGGSRFLILIPPSS